MKKILNLCNIYILLWIFGFFQSLFITSSFVSLMFSVPAMLITLYCFAKSIVSFRLKGAILVYCILFAVFLCYGIAAVMLNNDGSSVNSSFLLNTLISFGPTIAFYYFSRKRMLDEKKLLSWFLVFLVVAIVQYYDMERRAFEKLLEGDSQFDSVTNNASYYILGLFPFVFLLYKKPVVQYLVIGIIFYYVVSGMKRGALIIAAVLLLWFVIRLTSNRRSINRFIIVGLTAVLMIIGYRFVVHFYNSNNYFQYRIESTIEGSSSGRDMIFSSLWNHYLHNNNVFQMVFGEGARSTVKIAGESAHNDWLELLIDCGLITVFIYFLYYFSFYREWKKSKKDVFLYSMMGACFIFTFLRSFFSMSFSDMPYYMAMIMGYCFAQTNKKTLVDYD